MSVNDHDKDKVTRIIDDLIVHKDRLVRREIDASTCRTRSDFQRLHFQQDEYEKAYEVAVQEILQMVAHARRG